MKPEDEDSLRAANSKNSIESEGSSCATASKQFSFLYIEKTEATRE
jgi:hypothetical protein